MKKQIENLGLFGGKPAFREKLHVGRPNIGNRQQFLGRVNGFLDRRWLTNDGILVQELEQKIADMLGVRNCILVCNGTVALEIAIGALELHGEVIVPSFTFVATAHSLLWRGITPVFCDVDPETHSIDCRKAKKLITPRTTGIMGVHLWGQPCSIEELGALAKNNRLRLLFDAAHAFGCSYRGSMIGNFGEAEVFSFHATKFFNTLEGGAITTNDDQLAKKIRLMKNFGFAGYDNVVYIGTNGKMTEASAAMGLTNLESLDDFVSVNRKNHDLYGKKLKGISGVKLYRYDGKEARNYQYVIVEIDESKTHISRDRIVEILHAENIIARKYFYPGCHRMEPYRTLFPEAGKHLPVTNRLVKKVMALPTGTGVTGRDIAKIGDILQFICENGEAIQKRFGDA